MSKQCLDVQQMQHLQEMGLNLGETLLYWCRIHDNRPRAATRYGEWTLCKGHSQPTVSTCGWEYIPSYTLQDVLKLLPEELKPNQKRYWLRIDMSDRAIYYYHESTNLIEYRDVVFNYDDDNDESLIDAAYEMLCWAIENKFVETDKNE